MYKKLLSTYSNDELIQICKVLNKNYNIYDTNDIRWNKINYAFFNTSDDEISNIKNHITSNEFINDLFLKHYICERVVKYHFINFLKKSTHDIVAFEMSIGDSRIDICRINGQLCAYEIKTEYDNYDRLETQMSDYFKAFEKVYIIVPQQNVDLVKNYIPQKCGIISYRTNKNNYMFFSYRRKAIHNNFDINFCMDNLSSNDLIKILKILKTPYSKSRNENINLLLSIPNKNNLVKTYKNFLKLKYENQWKYLKEISDKILPIDYQSFFSTKMDPDILYEHKKSSTAL